jgi:hypothetical protein
MAKTVKCQVMSVLRLGSCASISAASPPSFFPFVYLYFSSTSNKFGVEIAYETLDMATLACKPSLQ